MPKKYTPSKRGHYSSYNHSAIEEALTAIKNGMSLRKAAQKFGIPRSTLGDRSTGRVAIEAKSGRKPYLDQAVENEIVSKVTSAASKGFGISRKQLLLKVGTLCQKTEVARFKNGVPSNDWWRAFKGRHPEISMRKPEKLGNVRARMLNPTIVGKYFQDLQRYMEKFNLRDSPECIWNADETGKQMEHNPVNIIALKGSRSVVSRTSDSKMNTTLMACVNAVGTYMPPMMIVKGKTSRSLHGFNTMDAPNNAVWTYQENAWINEDIALEWFREVFLQNCGPRRPQLLIMDGHASHESWALLHEAVDNGIELLALPPHTTHYLQPLDRSVFKSFNTAYDSACSEFLSARACNTINKWTFPGLIRKAWDVGMTSQNAMNGFRACGIYPFNENAVPKSAFEPSSVFEVPVGSAEFSPVTTTVIPADSSFEATPAPVPNQVTATATITKPLETSDATPTQHAVVPSEDSSSTQTVTLESSGENETQLAVAALQEVLNEQDADSGTNLNYLALEPDLSASINPQLDDPEYLLNLIQTGEIKIVTTADEMGTADLPSDIWQHELDQLFTPQGLDAPTATKKAKKVTTHRLLTCPEILEEKRKQQEEKLTKERLKKERQEKRLEAKNKQHEERLVKEKLKKEKKRNP